MTSSEATDGEPQGLVARLRAAGCVFAEDEARALLERAAEDPDALEQLALRRTSGEPLEPLLGWVDFGPLRLALGEGVFVPRQRSLQLARLATVAVGESESRTARRPVFLEAFCGVAPIAASVQAAHPGCRVLASDRDQRALSYARENLGPEAIIAQADVLDGLPVKWHGRIDVIAAVPPYVPEGSLACLPREARMHEPIETLLSGLDGLDHIRRLIAQSSQVLATNGCLLIEMHEDQCDEASAVGTALGLIPAFTLTTGLQTGVLELRRPIRELV